MSAQGGPSGWWHALRAHRPWREWRSWFTHRAAIGLLVAVVIVAVVADALPAQGPTSEPTGPSAALPTTALPTPAATEPPDAAWGDLAIPAWEPVADLEALDTDASGVAVGSAFVLRSRTAVAAAELAAGLTAEPAIDFTVLAGDSPAEARLVPAEPLAAGVVYRFRLADKTGALAGAWAYRTGKPLHVVTTIPGDQTTGVPVATGIELEFDQDGVTAIADHFAIEPAVAGRFETHGRTVVFVPARPLAPATVYRVTISAGVTMAGSDQVLESPVAFAFETAGALEDEAWHVALGRPILEALPGERAVIAMDIWYARDNVPDVTAVPMEVYRLPSLDAARAAAITLLDEPGWAQWSAGSLVATEGLPRVAAFDGTFESQMPDGFAVVRLPAPLDAGWYLIVVPRAGRDEQALLQVTDLTAYALTSDTRTVAWVNDGATEDPIAGATLVDATGATVGTTGLDGLLNVPTPATLRSGQSLDGWRSATLVTVAAPDGRQLLLALGQPSRTSAYGGERDNLSQAAEPSYRWWLLMSTDRSLYRSTDIVHAWGFIRSRDDRSIPSGLEVTLRTTDSSSSDGPWLARRPVAATARGTWAADIGLEGLPAGSYLVELHAGGTVATTTWIEVGEIRKPAYEIQVETDVRAAIAGDPVRITARAVFFDGTSAPGLDLLVEAFGSSKVLTTDAEGRATLTLPATSESGGRDQSSVNVRPAAPEEGEIGGSAYVLVVPAAVWLKGSGTVTDGTIVVSANLATVDLDRLGRELDAGGWPDDASGTAIPGGTVTAQIVERIPTATQVGTTYDYLEKVAVPLYEYTTQEKSVGTYTTTAGAEGAVTITVPAPSPTHEYVVTLTSRDAAGRTGTATIYASASAAVAATSGPAAPYLGTSTAACSSYEEEHAVGDLVSLTLHDGDGAVSTGGRNLFVVAGRGIREASLQDAPTLTRTYTEADLPGLKVIAVSFRNGTYVVTNQVQIRTRLDERTLGVELTADRARYEPGDRATVTVRTTDADGRAIPADVVIRGVDEKLFEMGGAIDANPLPELLSATSDGLLQSYASHPVPMFRDYGCGDTTGGGREEFRDSIAFQLVSTGADGTAAVTIDLPDDLTSWHVSGTAVASDLRAGDGTLLIPVGLPFFADAILASDYLVGERPVLRIRSFGDSLAAGERVRFTVTAPSLLLSPQTVDAAAFATEAIELPPLPRGIHEVTIRAAVIADAGRSDTLVRRVVVRSSRLEIAATQATTPASVAAVGGPGLTTYVVTDAGRGSLIPVLQDLAYGRGARFDRLLAADLARELLVGTFGFDGTTLPPVDLDVGRYQRGGVALLPYGSTDLSLTALSAIVAPERLDAGRAREALRAWVADASVTRERSIIATAGLAGLGDDVLAELHAVDVATVKIREALWAALGLAAAGDADGARLIERALLEQHGQELGPWVRLDVGGSVAGTLDATSLLALVAAGIGDPLAPRIARYVREMRTSEALYALSEIGVVRWSLDRLPRASARFAWTVDGARHVESLAPGASWSVALTERQRTGFALETLEGSLAVVAAWNRAPGTGDLPSGGLVTLTRTVTPVDAAPTTGLVKVRLRVVFDAKAPTGCWEVTDRTPSGLAPVVVVPGWSVDEENPRAVHAPTEVSGQRVGWCVDPVDGRDVELGYSARVVSAGRFTWEPAVIASVTAPAVGATTPTMTYTVR